MDGRNCGVTTYRTDIAGFEWLNSSHGGDRWWYPLAIMTTVIYLITYLAYEMQLTTATFMIDDSVLRGPSVAWSVRWESLGG